MRCVRSLASFLALSLAAATPALAGSLPSVSLGPRPGPEVLYAPLATAPELTNAPGGIWRAPSLMISGAEAYVDGEYVYQDYVYDDFGANTSNLPGHPPDPVPPASAVVFGGQTGDVVYPTDAEKYGNDAADLLEFRARIQGGKLVYRVTLNTMLDPSAAAVAIGIDDVPGGSDDWGHGIGTLGPLGLDHEIVVDASGATLDGNPTPFHVDPARHQIEVTGPGAAAGGAWKHYLVAGLADGAGGFKPILDQPTADSPGGAHGSNPPPVFNVGFRFDEPVGPGDLGTSLAGDPTASFGARTVGYGHWREHAQALALAKRDISAFHADVDMAKLAAGATDFSRLPQSGFVSRLYASHLDLSRYGQGGQGRRPTRPMLLGHVQPYGAYVPTTYSPLAPAPLTLELHSLSCTYNQYAAFAPMIYQELGEQRGSIVLTTEGRGPDGWYHDEAEVDLFEAWADLAARYALDGRRAVISGYSMGGYATFKIAAQYPDLFARGFAIVGPIDESFTGGPTGGRVAGAEDHQNMIHVLDNLRNVPLMMWNGTNDELVNVTGVLQTEQRLHDLGYVHELDLFPGYDHFLFSEVDRWGPGKVWLADDLVPRNPAHVTYRAFPEADDTAHALVHDHAYWVSDVAVAPGSRSGLVDVRSLARGTGDPELAELLPPVGLDPAPYLRRGRAAAAQGSTQRSNELVISLDGVSSVTLWPERGGVTRGTLVLDVASTTPATIVLRGTFGERALSVPAGHPREVQVSL